MSERFEAWPHDAEGIVREALREYVSDGDGEDEKVLAAYMAGVRAVARREGQAEALRAAANTDDPDHEIEVALGGSDYVCDWLNARADRIENGADL